MSYVACITTVFNVSFPQGWTKVLWGSSNCSHRTRTTIIGFPKVVFRLSEIDNFDFVRFWQ